jgi:hypothetical protein
MAGWGGSQILDSGRSWTGRPASTRAAALVGAGLFCGQGRVAGQVNGGQDTAAGKGTRPSPGMGGCGRGRGGSQILDSGRSWTGRPASTRAAALVGAGLFCGQGRVAGQVNGGQDTAAGKGTRPSPAADIGHGAFFGGRVCYPGISPCRAAFCWHSFSLACLSRSIRS